jgi:hypothetical protein
LTPAESRYFAVLAVGAVVLRNRVGGLASEPVPWRKRSVTVWAEVTELKLTVRRKAYRT